MYRKLTEGSGKVLAYQFEGRITREEQNEIVEDLKKRVADTGPVRLLIRIEGLGTPEPGAFLEDLSFIKVYSADIERAVIIGEEAWEETWTAIIGVFVKTEIRFFDRSDKDSAWEWIREEGTD